MFIKYIVVGALALTMLSGCSDNSSTNNTSSHTKDHSVAATEVAANAIQVGKDYHSFANPESIK